MTAINKLLHGATLSSVTGSGSTLPRNVTTNWLNLGRPDLSGNRHTPKDIDFSRLQGSDFSFKIRGNLTDSGVAGSAGSNVVGSRENPVQLAQYKEFDKTLKDSGLYEAHLHDRAIRQITDASDKRHAEVRFDHQDPVFSLANFAVGLVVSKPDPDTKLINSHLAGSGDVGVSTHVDTTEGVQRFIDSVSGGAASGLTLSGDRTAASSAGYAPLLRVGNASIHVSPQVEQKFKNQVQNDVNSMIRNNSTDNPYAALNSALFTNAHYLDRKLSQGGIFDWKMHGAVAESMMDLTILAPATFIYGGGN